MNTNIGMIMHTDTLHGRAALLKIPNALQVPLNCNYARLRHWRTRSTTTHIVASRCCVSTPRTRPWRCAPITSSRLRPPSASARNGNTAQTAQFLGITVQTWQKVIPLGLMFFGILFNYTLLRNTKDVLVVTAPGSGAEIIPFLKTWINLPSAITFTILFAKMSSVLSAETCFYVIMTVFLVFFMTFAFVVYPNVGALHPHALADRLLAAYPRAAIPIAILRNWTFAVFYVFAELWGSVVTGLLYWGTANTVCSVQEAQIFYPLFGLGANVSLVVAGAAASWFTAARASLPPGVDGWGYSLRGLMSMVAVAGVCVTGCYVYIMRVVKPGLDSQPSQKQQGKKKKNKAKMGVGESFAFFASSPYIRNLALLVVSYGVSINLVEVTWKAKLKTQFPDPNDYSQFMATFSSYTGIVTFSMMLLSRYIFTRFGAGTAALITPVVLLITGVLFFACVLFAPTLEPALAAIHMTPLMAAVVVGAAQNIFSKASKYSLFDPFKEMAYIPLDPDTQLKGKAAIDVVCSPLGKSGGSLVQQVLILTFGSLAASTPALAVILGVIVLVWINAAITVSGLFATLQAQQLEEQRVVAERQLSLLRSKTMLVRIEAKETDEGFLTTKVEPVVDVPEDGAAEGLVTAPAEAQVGPKSVSKVTGAMYGRALSRSLSSKINRGGASGVVVGMDDDDS